MWSYKTFTTTRNKGVEMGFTVFLLMQGLFPSNKYSFNKYDSYTHEQMWFSPTEKLVTLRSTEDRIQALHTNCQVRRHIRFSTDKFLHKSLSTTSERPCDTVLKKRHSQRLFNMHYAYNDRFPPKQIVQIFLSLWKCPWNKNTVFVLHLRMRWLKAAASSVSLIFTYSIHLQVAFGMNVLHSDLFILLPLG